MSIENVSFSEIKRLLKESDNAKTIKESLKVCRDFRDKHKLTDKEVLDIVNRRF